MTRPDNKRIEETLRLILSRKKRFKNFEELAQEMDNLDRRDVATWIRKRPSEFVYWTQVYALAYEMPDIDEEWQ